MRDSRSRGFFRVLLHGLRPRNTMTLGWFLTTLSMRDTCPSCSSSTWNLPTKTPTVGSLSTSSPHTFARGQRCDIDTSPEAIRHIYNLARFFLQTDHSIINELSILIIIYMLCHLKFLSVLLKSREQSFGEVLFLLTYVSSVLFSACHIIGSGDLFA